MKRGKTHKNEIAKDSKTDNKKNASLKIKYEVYYLNYEFIVTSDLHSLNLLYIICNKEFSNQTMQISKLVHHSETKHYETSI